MRGGAVRRVVIGLVGLLVIGGLWYVSRPRSDLSFLRDPFGTGKPSNEAKPFTLPNDLQQQLARAASAPPEQAHALYRQLTQIEARTAEAKYVVGYAHYQIGKLYAERKQFRQAQQAFAKLAQQRLNIPALPLDPSFGTWSEQGAYQAAICAYQFNPQAGIQQMIQFMEQYPTSPLVIGAYKRILRWTNDKPPAEAERAWQKAQRARREQMKRAAACGPKALAYVLEQEFGIRTDWRALMKECGTELEGTSLWALAQAARRRGISAVGLEVSRKGLLEQSPPFLVWNPIGHYVAIVERGGKWQVYDPEAQRLQPWVDASLPDDWRGAILLLRPRTLAKQTEASKTD